jgi:RNA-directed DNA polymerase
MGQLISHLSALSGLLERDVRLIMRTAPRRYKTYKIKKRNGGDRVISQPAKEVKLLQRLFETEYLSNLPVHPAAMAYEKGTSIRENADRHSPNGPILKLDFSNFFPSIRAKDWLQYADQHALLEDLEDRELAGRLLFQQPKGASVLRLAIGAPTSPHLSNLLMYEFDREMFEKAANEVVTYTRYADDLTFSAARTGHLQPIEKLVRRTLREIEFPILKLNDDKRVFATRKYRRMVTGVILTNDSRLSIGRERKKLIRSMIHYYIQNKLPVEEIPKLRGLLAFAKDVEPEFVLRMTVKYGEGPMSALSGPA